MADPAVQRRQPVASQRMSLMPSLLAAKSAARFSFFFFFLLLLFSSISSSSSSSFFLSFCFVFNQIYPSPHPQISREKSNKKKKDLPLAPTRVLPSLPSFFLFPLGFGCWPIFGGNPHLHRPRWFFFFTFFNLVSWLKSSNGTDFLGILFQCYRVLPSFCFPSSFFLGWWPFVFNGNPKPPQVGFFPSFFISNHRWGTLITEFLLGFFFESPVGPRRRAPLTSAKRRFPNQKGRKRNIFLCHPKGQWNAKVVPIFLSSFFFGSLNAKVPKKRRH